jgi:hypothetical protein
MAQRNPPLVALFYLLPALGAAGAIAGLAGYGPRSLLARWNISRMQGAA